jgi:myo-inositol-1(or 4)-monophosphatase
VWLDSHCHVTADEFEADRAEVLARAREDGVEAFVAIGSGYGVERNDRAVRLTESEPDVFATAGVHPHEANTLDAVGRGKLADWLAHPRVVAVGECGLDYHYTHSPREVQREVFAEQLASARERGLPVTIHVRGDDAVAYDDLLDLWRAEGRGELEGVLHCYTGTLEFACRALAQGLFISFSAARRGPGAAHRASAGGDGRPAAVSGGLSRQAQRAGARAPRRRDPGGNARGARRRGRGCDHPQRPPPVPATRRMSESHEVLELAERLARQAGKLQSDRYETAIEIRTKSASIDLVTEVDHACEELIVDALTVERPDDAILAEEGRGSDRPDAAWRWIIDPIDGTTNYAHGYPRFCVSIGVEREGIRTVGVVYDPLLDEQFSAVRGEGTTLNGRPLRVSEVDELEHALLATGFAYDVRRNPQDNVNHFIAFLKRSRALRRDGSAALDLAYVAAGRFDGFWELRLHAWDVAAGLLLVEEAGGRVSDLTGGPPPPSGAECLASNGRIHDAMLEILRS